MTVTRFEKLSILIKKEPALVLPRLRKIFRPKLTRSQVANKIGIGINSAYGHEHGLNSPMDIVIQAYATYYDKLLPPTVELDGLDKEKDFYWDNSEETIDIDTNVE